MVRSGSRTLPTGVVAHSKPVKAKKVRAVAAARFVRLIGTAASGSNVPPVTPRWPNSHTTASKRQHLDQHGDERKPARGADAHGVDAGQNDQPADRNRHDIVGMDEVRRDERHGRRRRDRDRPLRDRIRRPEAPGDEKAGGRPEFLLDIGLDAPAAEHRQPSEAISDADDPDAADQPGDQRVGAERRERDRKHENARADDRPDDDRAGHPDADRLRLARSWHLRPPGLGKRRQAPSRAAR